MDKLGKVRNQIEFVVYGEYALFTDPLMKNGGEKMTMQIPSYQALKGIVESVYWKPSIIWYIDEIRVMNPIRMESKGVRPIEMSGGNTLANYSYLRDVRYEVCAHFEFNTNRQELSSDFNEHKHHNIAKRCVERGGRRDIFLGTRECQAYVEPCEFGKESGYYDNRDEMHFGVMVHGINYPDETGNSQMETRLWKPVMSGGYLKFIRPEQCQLVRPLHEIQVKPFVLGETMQSVDDLEKELIGGD